MNPLKCLLFTGSFVLASMMVTNALAQEKPDEKSARRRIVLPQDKDGTGTPSTDPSVCSFDALQKLIAPIQLEPLSIQASALEYSAENVSLEGWLAKPKEVRGKNPGVLVIHDWTGVQAYSKGRAEQLAKLGYVAMVADIYGKGVRPADPKASAAEAGKYKTDRALFRQRLLAGLAELKKQPNVDPDRIVAVGYCFGGTGVLELARAGAEVKGVVSFHGGLDSPTPADGKNIKAKVLILHGADDPYVPAEGIAALTAELNGAKVDWQMVSYSGAVHSFTNPGAGTDASKGNAYNESADKRSWTAMESFFGEILTPVAK